MAQQLHSDTSDSILGGTEKFWQEAGEREADFSLVKTGMLRDILQETILLLWKFPAGDARKAAKAELKLKAEQSKSAFLFMLYFLVYTRTSAHTETYLQPRW